MATTFLGNLEADTNTVPQGTSANTAHTFMVRDASGQVAATTFTGALNGNAATATTATSATAAAVATTAANFSGALNGDVVGTQSATVVDAVGGVTAANVATAANAVNAASTAGYLLTASGTAGGAAFAAAPLSTMPASLSINTQAGGTGAYSLQPSDRGKIVTDAGTTVQQTYSLPNAPALGDTYYVISTTLSGGATAMKITCINAAHAIQLPTVTSATGSGHGIITTGSRTNGANLQLTYVATNTWRWTGGYPYDWTNY